MATWAERFDAYRTQEIARQRAENERNMLAEILRGAYEPAQAAIPATPDRPYSESDVGSGVGPLSMGTPIPGTGTPEIPGRPGGFNMQNAIARMAQSRFAPEALELQKQMTQGESGIRKVLLEHQLKQKSINDMFDRMQGLSGGSGLQPGYTMEIGPQGPKMSYDPTKAAGLTIDQIKTWYETGVNPLSGKGSGPRSPISPKGEAEATTKRLKDLEESASSRQSALSRALKFLTLIEQGKMRTGAGRRAAGYIPGVYTEQGQLDEEFNAFAETAARQALKAAGEQRPTDADVKGMKEAMFGIGRDEKTNINLLNNYIEQQIQDENAYLKLRGIPPVSRESFALDTSAMDRVTGPAKSPLRIPTGAKRFKDNQTGKEVFSTDGKTFFDVETGQRVK